MENASKALLIAGAILLVIALIAVGMSIFGTARGVVNNANGQIDNMSIQLHNQQFVQYDGRNLSLSEAKELLSIILRNNSSITDQRFFVKLSIRSYKKNATGTYYFNFDNNDSYNTQKTHLNNFFTPGIDFVGLNTYSIGNVYAIRLKYNENGIISEAWFYRQLQ